MKKTSEIYFACIGCGHTTDPYDERAFRCPKCGNLYEVCRDIRKDPEYWDRYFWRQPENELDRSGVWFFREAIGVAPDEYVVTAGEGREPYVEAGPLFMRWLNFPVKLRIHLQGKNPSGSFKCKGMTQWASGAKKAGVKKAGSASTGDTSASGALYSARAEIDFFALLPDGQVTFQQYLQVVIHGGQAIMVQGDFDECMKLLELLVEHYGVYPANSLNPFRIEGHQATVLQAYKEFGKLPRYFVAPAGNGSNLSSLGKGLRLMRDMGYEVNTKLIGCQAAAANPLSSSFWAAGGPGITAKQWLHHYKAIKVGQTLATAQRIGNPVSCEKVINAVTEFGGVMYDVTEAELESALIALSHDGIEACPQTAVAAAGFKKACHAGHVEAGSDALLISTADLMKFADATKHVFPDNVVRAKSCDIDEIASLVMAI